MGLLELIRKAKPEEKAAVVAELVDVEAIVARVRDEVRPPADPTPPTTTDGRVVMGADERAALAAELRLLCTEDVTWRQTADQRQSDLWQRRAALNREQEQLDSERFDRGQNDRINVLRAALTGGQDPLVPVLAKRCEDEAVALWPPRATTLPGEKRTLVTLGAAAYGTGLIISDEVVRDRLRREGGTVVSTGPYIEARQRGLRELAEAVRRWGRDGSYSDAADLQAKFDHAYAELPTVPGLDELVRAVRTGCALPSPPQEGQ